MYCHSLITGEYLFKVLTLKELSKETLDQWNDILWEHYVRIEECR